MLRGVLDRMLTETSAVVDDVVASDTFSKTLARGMAITAGATAAVRRSTHQVGEFAAEWLNVPTRRQMIEMARRMNHIELVLDDLDIKAEEVLRRIEHDDDDD
jgi:hypothetical protein